MQDRRDDHRRRAIHHRCLPRHASIREQYDARDFAGVAISPRDDDANWELLDELGVHRVAIRVPVMHEADADRALGLAAERCGTRLDVLPVFQDRRAVCEPDQWRTRAAAASAVSPMPSRRADRQMRSIASSGAARPW